MEVASKDYYRDFKMSLGAAGSGDLTCHGY